LKHLAPFAVVFVLALTGCAKKNRAHVPVAPVPAQIGSTETGIASWYGKPYDGRRAASGEIYDMRQLTAAHRTLPFNTWLEVTDLDNGKKVNVRINDRGPFVDHRIIDLSLAAARAIDMVAPGTARVQLKVIPAPAYDPAPAPIPDAPKSFAVQAGVFSDPDRAQAFAASLGPLYKDTVVSESAVAGRTVWKVLIARSLTLEDANALAAKLRETGKDALVVQDP
jgi:rare lipoprotein A